jgi:glutamine amidotransferase
MDARALTAPPLIRSASQQPPAQGNIKKKRASLGAVDGAHYGGGLGQYFDTSPVTPEPVRTEYGNPDKIARMFPELALQ